MICSLSSTIYLLFALSVTPLNNYLLRSHMPARPVARQWSLYRADLQFGPPRRPVVGRDTRYESNREHDRLREDGKNALGRKETSAEQRIQEGRESEYNRNEQKYRNEHWVNGNRVSKSDQSVVPRIENGNFKEGWIHIEARHINNNHPTKTGGDLFAAGTTRDQLELAAREVVRSGQRVSDPLKRIQAYDKRLEINGLVDRVRVVVDSYDNNRVITIFPQRRK